MTDLADERTSLWPYFLAVLIVLHVCADLLLLRVVWTPGDLMTVAVLAVPIAQSSLIALWAAVSRWPSYARFALGLVSLAAVWYVASRLLPWGHKGPAGATWALSFVAHVAIISIVLLAVRTTATMIRTAGSAEAERESFRFNLSSLILWTAVLAGLFAVIRIGPAHWGWAEDAVKWKFFWMMPIFCGYNALYALLIWFSLQARRLVVLSFVAATGLVLGLACTIPHVLAWLFRDTGGLDIINMLVLAAVQVAVLGATLIPWKCLAGGT